MRSTILLSSILLVTSLAAQTTSTLPKGFDTVEGTSNFWSGFDLLNGTTNYNPSRSIHMYDASVFPWSAAGGAIIQKLSFRRDGVYVRNAVTTTTAHTKEWTIIMSTHTQDPARANFHNYEDNHGSNKRTVFGAIGTGKTVSFQATPQPAAGVTAPFDVVVNLDTLFIVPANAKTLVIEIRSYNVTNNTGWWRTDSETYPVTGSNTGAYVVTNSDHCVAPSIFFSSRPLIIGSNFGHIWRSQLAPGGKPVLTWLGPRNTTLFMFPGTVCNVHVFPPIFITATTSGTSGQYATYVDWGKVPLDLTLVGVAVSHQSMFVDNAYPGGVGLTRGGTSTCGSGYNPAIVKGSQIYAFGGGANTPRYTAGFDPDTAIRPRWFYRRVPIIKIN